MMPTYLKPLLAASFACVVFGFCLWWRRVDRLPAWTAQGEGKVLGPRQHNASVDEKPEALKQTHKEAVAPSPDDAADKKPDTPKQAHKEAGAPSLMPRDHQLEVPRLRDDLLEKFLVVPEHRLLFCYIEKVGCANFNQLFNRLRSRYNPKLSSGPIWGRNVARRHGFHRKDLERMLVDKTWHKAVFYRQPVERFVSAYASKCGHADPDGQWHCRVQFGSKFVPFEQAIQFIADYDATGSRNDSHFNRHWRRMVDFCGGLDHTLQYYNTVEELTVETSNEKVSKLLNAVGVDPQSIEGFDQLFPPSGNKTALAGTRHMPKHITNTEKKMALYFPAPLAEKRVHVLVEHYKEDYELFGIKIPSAAPHH